MESAKEYKVEMLYRSMSAFYEVVREVYAYDECDAESKARRKASRDSGFEIGCLYIVKVTQL